VFHLSADELLAKGRKPAVARARQLAIYIARERLELSLSELARAFQRDRSTILHSLREVEKDLTPGSRTAEGLDSIRKRLSAATEGVGPEPAGSAASPPPLTLSPQPPAS
jgi:chromosomal replication initiator protein